MTDKVLNYLVDRLQAAEAEVSRLQTQVAFHRSLEPTVSVSTGSYYLGDAVYVHREDGRLVLETTDGLKLTNVIFLEPEVYKALKRFAEPVQPVETPVEEPAPEPAEDRAPGCKTDDLNDYVLDDDIPF